jgi:hypothetical protein
MNNGVQAHLVCHSSLLRIHGLCYPSEKPPSCLAGLDGPFIIRVYYTISNHRCKMGDFIAKVGGS